MKIVPYTAVVLLYLTAFSCKKESYKTTEVITNCTGTYLRWDGKDYKVCNLEKVSSFSNGTAVRAVFKKLTECNGSGNFPVTCFMNHEYDSWIEVEEIK